MPLRTEVTGTNAAGLEAEALASAREYLDRLRSYLGPETGREFLRNTMRWLLRQSVTSRLHVISRARAGYEDADLVVRELCLEMESRGEQLPTELSAYRMDIMAAAGYKRRRGKKKVDNLFRDIVIVLLVEHLVSHFGLSATRNSATRKRPSACSVAGKAIGGLGINIGEKAVEAIWTSGLGPTVRSVRPIDPFVS